MTNKTQSKITNILKEDEELEALEISKKGGLTYDTIAKNLKKMVE